MSKHKQVVVSFCDGISCGQIALKKLGITDYIYHAFETDKYASAVAKYNNKSMFQHGDVRNYLGVYDKYLYARKVDLFLSGFPCQPFSVAGKRLGTQDERDLSTIVFDAMKLLRPEYFLIENVPMKKTDQDRISKELGVEPIIINSADFSAQNRKRLYWTNIPVSKWTDKGIVLNDIVEEGFVDRNKSHCLDANYHKGGNLKSYFNKHRRQLVFSNMETSKCKQVGVADLKGHDILKRVYCTSGKAPTVNAMTGGNREPKIVCGSIKKDNVLVDNEKMYWRALTPLECERLQTIPDGYTSKGDFSITSIYSDIKDVSNHQRYKQIGNGWTVDVIAHILKGIKNECNPRIHWEDSNRWNKKEWRE